MFGLCRARLMPFFAGPGHAPGPDTGLAPKHLHGIVARL